VGMISGTAVDCSRLRSAPPSAPGKLPTMTKHLVNLRTGLAAVGLLATAAYATLSRADDAPAVDYARDVRPILQDNCYRCHDARKQTAALRLDVRSRARRGGESGKAAVVSGDAAGSE